MSWVPAPPPACLHDLILRHSGAEEARLALVEAASPHPGLHYGELAQAVDRVQSGLQGLGLQRGDRVAVYLDKRAEAVVGAFAATAAGGVLVPINPALKAPQVLHVLRDARARVLVTSAARWQTLSNEMTVQACGVAASLQAVVVVDAQASPPLQDAGPRGLARVAWSELLHAPGRARPRVIDSDLAAILYTSGSTGLPKGVMLSHRNLVVGAHSVVAYLHNGPDDVLLAALPLSFDAGFSQLTTAFTAGARVVLLNHLLPQDVPRALAEHGVTGLTAVPPLYHQVAQWANTAHPGPEAVQAHGQLRYFASTGGPMPAATLRTLRRCWPQAQPFLMYGLTEAFRSTVLPPSEVDRRPGSIGKAIPNVEVLVLDEQGCECPPDVPGELVHRGPLVAMGYWGDAERTAQRFRPLPPGVAGRLPEQVLPEWVVYSGDRVRRDADGFLYHLGRFDEMIKTSGYRVSPAEVEPALLGAPGVDECVVLGQADEALGQRIVAVVAGSGTAADDATRTQALLRHCRQQLPAYLVPARVVWHGAVLPRNANGKLDRAGLKAQYAP
ncbi:MAG: acyl-CoA ligase (AMP-forming), exosortase A system-associated [Betaproteobacteria bacterium]